MLMQRDFVFLVCIAVAVSAQVRQTWETKYIDPPPAFSSMDYLATLSKGAEEFSLELFSKTCDLIAGEKNNLMISPFSVWALLLLLTEGAAGETLRELEVALRVSNNTALLRQGYQEIERILNVKTSTIEVATMQAIFHDRSRPLYRNYETVVENQYKAELNSVDLYNPEGALQQINKRIETATRGLIGAALTIDDLVDAQLLMVSSIYFKGQWKLPFNSSFTKEEPFYNENGEEIAKVQMMTQTAAFNYAPIVEMESHVLDLPYGKEDRLSMLVIIPKKGVPLNDAIKYLRKVGLEKIFNEIDKNEKLSVEYEPGDVEVYMPKFITKTSLTMNAILENMGINDIFQPRDANLTRMSPQALYLSRIIHQTKIEVNEEGTVAAAVTSGIFANKASPPRFYLNRPFAYLIVEKTTRSLLFCGQVTKPYYNK